MNTTNLLIAFLLFIALPLMQSSTQEPPIFEVPQDAQAGDLTAPENGDQANSPR